MKGDSTINFDTLGHGISSDRKQWNNNNIKYAKVIFLGSGVLFELSRYLEEEAVKKNIQYMICFIILSVFIGLFQLPINVQNYLYQLET